MNVKLLEKVIERIEKDPIHFHMDVGIAVNGLEGNSIRDLRDILSEKACCGTTCCIAGWAYLIHKRIKKPSRVDWMIVEDKAQKMLGLTFAEADTLFYHYAWPKKYFQAFQKAKTEKGRARVAINYLKSLIKEYKKNVKTSLGCS